MRTKMLARTALFAALTAVGAFIKIPLGVSSITLQFFFTAMAGCLLGPVWGTVSQGVYVLGVFAGREKDLAAEKKIFGRDFAYIRDIQNFSRVTGRYLRRLLEEL